MTNRTSTRSRRIALLFALVSAVVPPVAAASDAPPGPAAETPVLPPVPEFSGASLALTLPAADPWATPFERSGLERTPRCDETVAWLRRLADESPEVEMTSIGVSPEGREIVLVIASRDKAFTPAALAATGKPLLFAQGGIHAGEIDGKDAGMMLLRDMTVRGTKSSLLDRANLAFVPIFNVDGHERFSRFGRINQRGPVEMGWRTTARNLNLNRDYGLLDSPEMRAMVAALVAYAPDLYVDVHVTDGADYQYDVTWGYNGPHAWSPRIAGWLDSRLSPALMKDLREMGHVPGRLVFLADESDPRKGNVGWTAGIKFSNGYGDARHLPTVLVENHSLKPYPQRVLGTYVFLETALEVLGEHAAELRGAVAADSTRRPSEIPLAFETPKDGPFPRVEFLGIEPRLVPSPVSGRDRVEWTGKRVSLEVPLLLSSKPARVVKRATAYWIPAPWTDVIERLALHGVRMERIGAPRTIEADAYRIEDVKVGSSVVEGRVPFGITVRPERRSVTLGRGSVRVPTDQPLGDLAALLLEPDAPDSFIRCGFFGEVLQRTEYFEAYVLEPMAERMLAESGELRKEFEAKLASDQAFAADARARLEWFYLKTPFHDDSYRLYPVVRE